jgi:lipid-A-disaccharide synthase
VPGLFLAAAEASGDNLGAELALRLRKRVPELPLFGLAGPRMRQAGVEALARGEDAGGLGLVEVVRQIPSTARLLRTLGRAIDARAPSVVLTIDAPSLLLRLARQVRRPDRVNLHWVSPQLWAWRPGRVDAVAASVDAVLCLLPFEPALYAGRVRALFVGHPAVALPDALPSQPAGSVALCPGSRPAEIAALWPVLREVARQIRARRPEARFVVPVAPSVERRALTGLDCAFVSHLHELAGCEVAVTASGTATLELAALDVPMVVVYRVHPVTAAIARRWLTIEHVSLPNVLAGRPLVPEHLQELDPAAIAEDALRWWGRREQVPRALVESLQGPGAVERVADEVCAWLSA